MNNKISHLRIVKADKPEEGSRETLAQDISGRLDRLERELKKLEAKVPFREPPQKRDESPERRELSLSLVESFLRFLQDFWFGSEIAPAEFDEFGMDPSWVKRVKPIFDFLYYDYWRVKVDGLLNIPKEGAGLIVANHSGTLPYLSLIHI